jgi:hypothetical protein
MDAHKQMGQNNITYEDLKKAADENGKSVADTLKTFDATAAKDRAQHDQEYASSGATAGTR